MNNECGCAEIGELTKRVDKLEERVDRQTENAQQLEVVMVSIQKDLEYIKEKIAKSTKFNSNIVNAVINTIIAIVLTYIAVRAGIA